jgi:hypothetical protein
VTHASVFDLERGVCIEVITLSGNGGRIYNNTSPSIPAGGIRFKQGGSVAVEASPESTPAWHQFRHTAPGDCPCGIVKSMCEYHR